MTIVVTGASGFLAGALRRLCAGRGIGWVGVDTAPPAGPGDIAADICDPSLAGRLPAGADALVHLAAVSRGPDCRRDLRRAAEINILGTLNVYEAARRAGIPQLVFASSEWVYGDSVSADEAAPIDANRMENAYAVTKIAAERLLAAAAAGPGAEGPAVTVLRFGILYGPRAENWSAVEALYHDVASRDVVTVGSRATARRFLHVDDAARGIVAALGRRERFEVFNLTGAELVTLEAVVRSATALLGRAVRIVETDPRNPSVRDAGNRLARERLGWEPRISLREGLATLGAAGPGRAHA